MTNCSYKLRHRKVLAFVRKVSALGYVVKVTITYKLGRPGFNWVRVYEQRGQSRRDFLRLCHSFPSELRMGPVYLKSKMRYAYDFHWALR